MSEIPRFSQPVRAIYVLVTPDGRVVPNQSYGDEELASAAAAGRDDGAVAEPLAILSPRLDASIQWESIKQYDLAEAESDSEPRPSQSMTLTITTIDAPDAVA